MTEPVSEAAMPTSEPLDTRHEAHPHARPRVLWGIAAVLAVAVGFLVWFKWGEAIKDACTGGDDNGCALELESVPEGGAAFDMPNPALYE